MTDIYFKPSEYSMEIVGEAKTQKAIKEIIMYKIMVEKDDLEYKDEKLTAVLVLEDDNKFDLGNAVRVDIDDKPVGYLAKEDATRYRKALKKLGISNERCTCKASAFGKREDFGKSMFFGIWLFIDLGHLEIGELPPKRKKLFGIF
jgi:hypothetical protein